MNYTLELVKSFCSAAKKKTEIKIRLNCVCARAHNSYHAAKQAIVKKMIYALII